MYTHSGNPPRAFHLDAITRNGFMCAVLVWLITVISLIIFYPRLPPQTPFFYSLTRGEQQLANKHFLAVIPLISLIFIFTHYWLVRINFITDITFARLLSLTTILVTFLFTVSLIHIINIVT